MTTTTAQPDNSDELLELARRGLAPKQPDQARVLAALEQRLGLPPAPEAQAEPTLHGADAPPAAADASQPVPLQPLSAVQRYARFARLAALTVAGAMTLGLIMRSQQTPPPPAAVAPAAVASPSPAVTQQLPQSTPTLSPPTAASPAPEDPSAATQPKQAPRKKCRTASGVERPCAKRHGSTGLAQAPSTTPKLAPPAPGSPSSLRMELAALRKAELALRSGHPAQALEALEAFTRQATDGGKMQEEREAAASMAHCQLSPSRARTILDAFAQRYPDSAYKARIQQSCQVRE